MEALKKQRKACRAAFTRALNAFDAKMDSECNNEEKLVTFQLLELKMTELDTVQSDYNKELFQSKESDDLINKELETDDAYKTQYLTAKMRTLSIVCPQNSNPTTRENSSNHVKTSKLPKLELPKFDGNIKDWLPFWSQFKKINDDSSISNEDKFQYLQQAMVADSRASDLVKSFPPTGENYNKAVTSLKNRFGRDDIIVEFYVRELLGLVLQNAVKGNKKSSLTSIYDKVECYIRALETLGVTTNKCAAMLYPLVESSLPEDVLRAWQRSGQRETTDANETTVTADRLTKLLKFLQLEVENEERIEMAMSGFGVSADQDKVKKGKGKIELSKDVASASALFVSKEQKTQKCIFCQISNHESQNCESARKLSLDARRETVKKERACYNCLKRGHISQKCRAKLKCDWCGKNHVLLMCNKISCNNSNSSDNLVKKDSIVRENNLAAFCETHDVCLQTLRVKLYSQTREKIVRVIIDTGSQCSYIRSSVALELGYDVLEQQEIVHALFGGVSGKCEKHDVFLIRLRNLDGSYACNFSAMDQNTICGSISCIKNDEWVNDLRAHKINLTDVGDKNDPIDVLIGADVAGKLMTGKKYDLENGLTAVETFLGWTVIGKLPKESKKSDSVVLITSIFAQEANLADLWNLDILGITDPIQKSLKIERDEKVREFLINTTKLNPEGHYEVNLPWVEDHAPISSNYYIACNRLQKCIDKLKAQNLFESYSEVFNDWLSENIIEVVPDDAHAPEVHYLPHRPVIKPQSTTKIRPVFDASASSKGSPSLNQCLEKGPNLIEQVPASLNRFREGEIGVVSDIKKAFLQIAVNKKDRDFLRFLWVVNGKIVVFRHTRVVFGLSCSPFLLAAIIEFHLNFLCKKNSANSGLINKLKESFYVDNCVTSVNTKEELSLFVKEATQIMAKGGFDLRGWESSSDLIPNISTLVLGISWNKSKDTLSINPSILNISNPKVVTKREILSCAHKVFDPIGFTCPVSLLPKLLLKELWREKIDWDSEILDSRGRAFKEWLVDLIKLNELEIPRKLGSGNLTLHTFCDASGAAYAAVVFSRVEINGAVKINLLSAKSRVAPEKYTIPRLELMAATIAVRLTDAVTKSLTRKVLKTTFWSDSTTVLAWIRRDIQWGTFVFNRVKEIRASSSIDSWRYVPGTLNPADLPSRGCTSSQLLESKWWFGPEWLYKPELEWPKMNSCTFDENTIRSEVKKSVIVNTVSKNDSTFKVLKYFSSYSGIVHFIAWMRRFLENRKKLIKLRGTSEKHRKIPYLSTVERKKLCLTPEELNSAEIILLKKLQIDMFSNNSKEKLSSFKTILDKNELYALKTKIFYRNDDLNFVCPILLDNKSDVVYLLIRETHEKMGHAGTQIVINYLREKYWIIGSRKIIKSVISNCIICKRQKVKYLRAESPPLPLNRVRDASIFEIVGVDFAGPLFLKGGGKAWICLFTCAVYRAVHFELASSLSTECFLECLRRFIARRGRCRVIYSDNGTNFTGSSNAFDSLDWERIKKYSFESKIEWYFNPPAAPWWGGWWERLVGVLKTILRKVLGKACLSYEALYTTLCDAEAIVNSRPLTYVSEDPDDLKPLTPAMFLVENQGFGVPDCDMIYHDKLNGKLKYRQKIHDDLRKRFRSEYLSQLLLKNGKKETRNVRIGDIVLIENDSPKRIDWPLARIVDAIPGRDGQNRVLMLKTKSGILKRPLQRVYPLEISQDDVDLFEKICSKAKSVNSKTREHERSNVKELEKIQVSSDQKNFETDVPKKTRSGRLIVKPDRFKMA